MLICLSILGSLFLENEETGIMTNVAHVEQFYVQDCGGWNDGTCLWANMRGGQYSWGLPEAWQDYPVGNVLAACEASAARPLAQPRLED